MMIWMVVGRMTETVEIEVRSLLPIAGVASCARLMQVRNRI